MRKLLISYCIALVCAVTAPVFSQETHLMPAFAPEVKRIAVFKNGYAFTYREGEAQTSNGWVYTTRQPIGVLGTIWGYSQTPNVRVAQLLATATDKNETERVTNLIEFLLANENSVVRVQVANGNGQIANLEGTYQVISAIRGFKDLPVVKPDQSAYESPLTRLYNEMAIALQTERGTIVFSTQKIESIEVIGQPKWDKPKTTKESRLAIRVENAANNQKVNLGVAALERGVRWIPAYRVEVKGAPIKEAKLELEAMLINELADLSNSEVYFVVGVPSFVFQEAMSPLSLNTAFAGVSGYFQNDGKTRREAYSNAIQSQTTAEVLVTVDGSRSNEQQIEPAPTVATEERSPSLSAEQLFLYKADRISLKKGERTSLRLFSLTVPCSEVFEYTISDPPQTDQTYLNNSYSQNQSRLPNIEDLASRVWYALKLKNETEMPWTTAPALSFREWKPLGQNLLSFTPVSGENILRVTPATEVIGSHKLEEKQRTREQIRYHGGTYDFDLVTIEGTINIRNVKNESIELALTRNVVGEVLTAGDNGAISREGLNLQAVNPNSTIKWNLSVAPGERKITYTYKVYVRK